MINNEIFYGIKSALEKKETLKSAMISFYNAGYSKAEIEEAARAIQMEQFEVKMNAPSDLKQKSTKTKFSFKKTSKQKSIAGNNALKIKNTLTSPIIKPAVKNSILPTKTIETKPLVNKTPSAPIINSKPKGENKTKQKVSEYGVSKKEDKAVKPKKDLLIFFLVLILIVLLGVLAAVFLFKDNLIALFNGL
jgi:hypothetical protein